MAAQEGDWRASVKVRPAADLAARWAALPDAAEPAIAVTDLLDLRTSFFRRTHPLPFTPEQRARLATGRELHAELGARLAARPGELEVRLRREGLVGQIDWLADVPTELKSTGTIPPSATLREARPQYLDQLGMYCAMVGGERGRLLLVPSDAGSAESAAALDVRFAGIPEVWEEMQRRGRLLRAALASGDPGALPRCTWFGRGCPYLQARVCPCTGTEEEHAPIAADRATEIVPNASVTERLQRALSEVHALPPSFPERFTDLIYPRRAYFRRIVGDAPVSGWTGGEARGRLFRRIVERIESTDPAGQGRALPLHGGVRELVPRMEGLPYVLKTTRAPPRPSAEAMLAEQSQYFLELGLRCQSVDSARGWLIVGYERPAPGAADIAPFLVEFEPLSALRGVAEGRESALRAAIEDRRPQALPACPPWMFRDCPYRSECGCGVDPGAVKR